jgi:hypothetical protein
VVFSHNQSLTWRSKGTRRLSAVLKGCFLIKFGGFAKRPLAARPLPLRYVSSLSSENKHAR